MKQENLRKYKDISSRHREEGDLPTKPKRDGQWYVDQYNRNRTPEDYIGVIEKKECASKHPTQEEIIDYNRIQNNTCGRSESDPVTLWNNRKENKVVFDDRDGVPTMRENEMVDHPTHYGGEDNVYEAIKVIEAWGLGFNLGNTIKYVSRAEKKSDTLEDLEKASWYINREIKKLKKWQK